MQVAGREVGEPRIRGEPVRLLCARRLEPGQGRVRLRGPLEQGPTAAVGHQVAVERHAGRGGLVDPDLADRARAPHGVVPGHVVAQDAVARAALQVDAGGGVADDRVGDDRRRGRRGHVDAVVAVVVADVAAERGAGRRGVALEAGVVVVAAGVALDDDVARPAGDVDAGRDPAARPLVGVRRVPGDRDPLAALHAHPVELVVVGRRAPQRAVRAVEEPHADGEVLARM